MIRPNTTWTADTPARKSSSKPAPSGINLVGPVKQAGGHQAHTTNGYAATDFHIDWNAKTATCPQGKNNTRWIETTDKGEPRVHIDFYKAGCPACPAKAQCTVADFRVITLRPRDQHELLEQRRAEQHTDEWKERYKIRAGVEGTISQAVQRTGARRTRYRSLPKTRLAHVFTAAALNLHRLDAWWTGKPLSKTRISQYEQLALTLTE